MCGKHHSHSQNAGFVIHRYWASTEGGEEGEKVFCITRTVMKGEAAKGEKGVRIGGNVTPEGGRHEKV